MSELSNDVLPKRFPLARNPIGPAPQRRPGSVRRTSTIDTTWPDGYGTPMHMQGHARDLWTPADGSAPQVLAEDRYSIIASLSREIMAIEVSPDKAQAQALIGIRAGGESRAALSRIMADERIRGTPLAELREAVLETLPGALGCTHLNDVLRSMAEVPVMAAHLID